MMHDLVFIGAGNMAEALCRGVLDADIFGHDRVLACDPSEERRAFFAEKIGIAVSATNDVAGAGIVLLAVKPQKMGDILAEIGPSITSEQLIISIAAGVRTERIESACVEGCRVVRVMPNTPMLVGEGMSALCRGRRATRADMETALKLFRCAGEAVVVEEPAMDAVTAVSGSGPAYFFYLVEAMTEAGAAEGLTRALAAQLAAHTLLGASALLTQSRDDAPTLRRKVTSPGGTTEAAIGVMDGAGVRDAIIRAVRRAAERSRELSG